MSGQTVQCIVMFADVVGSTAMYDNMGDTDARERISRALNTLISICKRHKGVLIKTIGDEILVYFLDVDLSLMAAQTIQETMEDDRAPATVGISIRIGLHYGSAILDNNDIFGDTVNVAARIAGMAKARQILYSDSLAGRIHSSNLNEKTRKFDRVQVKGKEKALDIFQLSWEEDGEITDLLTGNMFAIPAKTENFKELLLAYHSQSFKIDLSAKPVSLGRDNICTLKITGSLISRLHAQIKVQRGKFILVDQSTNGSYVCINDQQKVFLRREELTLFGRGKITLGKPVEDSGDNILYYSCS